MPLIPEAKLPVMVLSSHVGMQLRLRSALEQVAPVECVSTEAALIARLGSAVRLVLVHGVDAFADPRLPGRIRKSLPDERTPIVVLASSKSKEWICADELIASGQIEDLIHTDIERVDSLVTAWGLHSDRCRRKVEALRLAHESAPDTLHEFLEELLLQDSSELSVAAWAERSADGSRFALRRGLKKQGVTPSVLVDAARVLNTVARVLVRGRGRVKGRMAALPDVRAARRLLMRTLGIGSRDVDELTRGGGDHATVRQKTVEVVGQMLREGEGSKSD